MLHAETGKESCKAVTAISRSGDENGGASFHSDDDIFECDEDGTDDFEEMDGKIELNMRFPRRLSCTDHLRILDSVCIVADASR